MLFARAELEPIAQAAIDLGLARYRWGSVALTWRPPTAQDAPPRTLLSVDFYEFATDVAFMSWLDAAHRAFPAPAFFEALTSRDRAVIDDPVALAEPIAQLIDSTPMLCWLQLHRPRAWCLALADGLDALGAARQAADRASDACRASAAAVHLLRGLAADAPDLRPRLAVALRCHGVHQRDLGEHRAAIAALSESVDLLEACGAPADQALRLEALRGLVHLGVPFSALGRNADALAANQRALRLARLPRTQSSPTTELEYSMALDNIAHALSGLERWDEAFDAAQDAVACRRVLASSDPTRAPALSSALVTLGEILIALDRDAAACEATVEAITHLRDAGNDARSRFMLAVALNQLGELYERAGQIDDAIVATSEALDVSTAGVADRPGLFSPAFMMAAEQLTRLQTTRNLEAALATCRTWVAMCRRLEDAEALAVALRTLDERLITRGTAEESREAIEALEELAGLLHAAEPTNALAHAQALHRRGRRHQQLDEGSLALSCFEAAVALLDVPPEAHREARANSLYALGRMLKAADRAADARAAIAESVHHFRVVAEATEAQRPRGLLHALGAWSALLHEAGDYAAALVPCEEACALYARCAERGPVPPFCRAEVLALRSMILKALGDREAARASALSAVELIWPVFLQAPILLAEETGRLLDECFDRSLPDLELVSRRRTFKALTRGHG